MIAGLRAARFSGRSYTGGRTPTSLLLADDRHEPGVEHLT